jgi:hypothetical protein
MFCPHCSDSNPDDAKFCGKCGRALPVVAAAPAGAGAAAAASAAALPAAAVSDGLKWTVAVASVLIPFIGLVMGIIYLVDANPAKKAVGKFWLMAAGIGLLLYILVECGSTPTYY